MRKRVSRRALALIGAMAVIAVGLGMGSSPAGASDVPGYAFHYPEANCVSSTITFSIGAAAWAGQGVSGGASFSVPGFCPLSGYTEGQVVFDTDQNHKVYSPPTYSGPDSENLPGTTVSNPPRSDGTQAQFDADRLTQLWDYQAALAAVGNQVYIALGSPPAPGPDTPIELKDSVTWHYWAVWEAAANVERAIDQINHSFSQRIPVEAVANLPYDQSCIWIGPYRYCSAPYNYRWNGMARLRYMAPDAPITSWFWMNNWPWSGGNMNGNISTSWAPYGWAGAIGEGGMLAGCAHTDTGEATGSANATVTNQVWEGDTTFGCGLIAGDNQGGVIAFTGAQAVYRVAWVGGPVGT
jgi:hypothetical protein